MTSIKKKISKLEYHINKTFTDITVGFCISKRNNFVHLGIDESRLGVKNYANIIAEINFFFQENLSNKFLVNYPYSIPTVKWKFDYIVAKKRKRFKK